MKGLKEETDGVFGGSEGKGGKLPRLVKGGNREMQERGEEERRGKGEREMRSGRGRK